jgi:uncharacterized protein
MFEKLSDPKDVRLIEGYIPLRHRYTPGVGAGAFFEALKDRGELLASACETCGYVYCPARIFCERCFSRLEPDTVVGPEGTLEALTVVYVGVDGEPLEEPRMVGLIRPDGADTVLMHFLLDGDSAPGIGDRVEAVFEPKTKRTGSILDLRGFRPAGG